MTVERRRPTYALEALWSAIDDGRCVFPAGAREGRNALGFTEQDGNECLKSLTRGQFDKGEPDRKGRKGVFHDSYKTVWDGKPVYIKFFRLADDEPFIVSSFKSDTDADF